MRFQYASKSAGQMFVGMTGLQMLSRSRLAAACGAYMGLIQKEDWWSQQNLHQVSHTINKKYRLKVVFMSALLESKTQWPWVRTDLGPNAVNLDGVWEPRHPFSLKASMCPDDVVFALSCQHMLPGSNTCWLLVLFYSWTLEVSCTDDMNLDQPCSQQARLSWDNHRLLYSSRVNIVGG